MIRIEYSIVINLPIEEVFEFLANPENNSKWNPMVEEIKITSEGPIGVGTTGISIGVTSGRRYETEFVYDAYEPPVKVSGHTTSGPIEVWYSNTCESLKDGTRVTHVEEVKLGGLLKLAEPIWAMSLKNQTKENIANLKELLESG